MSMTVRSTPAVRIAPKAQAAAPAVRTAAPAVNAKAQGAVQAGGTVAGAVVGGVSGFAVSGALTMFYGLLKYGMKSAPAWVQVAAWVGVGASTLLGMFAGSKMLGGLGAAIENWTKK